MKIGRGENITGVIVIYRKNTFWANVIEVYRKNNIWGKLFHCNRKHEIQRVCNGPHVHYTTVGPTR